MVETHRPQQAQFDTNSQECWVSLDSSEAKQLPEPVLDLLGNLGSMTSRLKHLNQQCEPVVEVLHKSLSMSMQNAEAAHLLLNASVSTALREVLIQGLQQPWILARSVLNNQFAQEHPAFAALEEVVALEGRPIGPLLFANHNFSRTFAEIAQISPATIKNLFSSESIQKLSPSLLFAKTFWVRRSIFSWQDTPCIVLTEVIFDALLRVQRTLSALSQ